MLYTLLKDNIVQSNVHVDNEDELPDGFVAILCSEDQPAILGYIWNGVDYEPTEEPPRLVKKSLMVDRLQDVGLLETARSALNSASLYDQERWNTRDSVYSNDPTTIALLTAIGADVDLILAA